MKYIQKSCLRSVRVIELRNKGCDDTLNPGSPANRVEDIQIELGYPVFSLISIILHLETFSDSPTSLEVCFLNCTMRKLEGKIVLAVVKLFHFSVTIHRHHRIKFKGVRVYLSPRYTCCFVACILLFPFYGHFPKFSGHLCSYHL